ncbi:hypothetical protein YC2023_102062 [Brassica napus]
MEPKLTRMKKVSFPRLLRMEVSSSILKFNKIKEVWNIIDEPWTKRLEGYFNLTFSNGKPKTEDGKIFGSETGDYNGCTQACRAGFEWLAIKIAFKPFVDRLLCFSIDKSNPAKDPKDADTDINTAAPATAASSSFQDSDGTFTVFSFIDLKSGKTLEITKTYDDKGKETWDNGQIDITKASGKCNLSLVVP